MSETPVNGHLARNALLLAAVAAGVGLAVSRPGTPAALAKGTQDLGRWMRHRLDGAGEWAGGLVERLPGQALPPRLVPRKLASEEPMAGYGA